MSKVTNVVFRELCATLGADITISEMVSVKGLLYNNNIARKRILRDVKSKKFGVQLLVTHQNDLITFLNTDIDKSNIDFIDLNLGCPNNHIIKQGGGASWLKKKREKELMTLLESIESSQIPVSVKMRAGFSKIDIKRLLGKVIDNSAVFFYTMHPRLAINTYALPANPLIWDKCKEITNKDLVINGDINSQIKISKLWESKTNGIMIGRTALKNPLIFQKVIDNPQTSLLDVYILFINIAKKYHALNTFSLKRVSVAFLRHMKYATKIRKSITQSYDNNFIIQTTKKVLKENIEKYHYKNYN